MVTREGIDYSGTPPTVAAMRAAGKSFVVRYARSFTHPKSITAPERATFQAAGIDIAIVEESSADRALDGRPAGSLDARAARDAIVKIGGPADGVIYCAVDFDVQPAEVGKMLDYIRGFADVLGFDRTGVYGPYAAVKAAFEAKACRYLWQTYAWSGGQVYPGIHLYQYRNAQQLGGVEVDFCRTSLTDFGQWGAQTGDDMFEDADRAKLNDVATKVATLHAQITGAVGAGQVDYQGTIEATLKTVQGIVNQLNKQTGVLAQNITDAKTAVVSAVAAQAGTADLSPESQAELLTKVQALLDQLAVTGIDPDVIVEAIRTDFGQRLLGGTTLPPVQ